MRKRYTVDERRVIEGGGGSTSTGTTGGTATTTAPDLEVIFSPAPRGKRLSRALAHRAVRNLLPERWSPGTRPARLASAMIAVGDVIALLSAMLIAGTPAAYGFYNVAASLLVLAATGAYRPRFDTRLLHQLPRLVTVLAVSSLAVTAVAVAVDAPHELFLQDVLGVVLVLVARAISYAAVRFERRRGLLSEPVAILGNGLVTASLVEHMCEHPEYGLKPIGYLGPGPNPDCRAPWLGGVDAVDGVVERHGLRRLIVAHSNGGDDHVVEVWRVAAQQGVDVHVVPRFFDVPSRVSWMDDEIWGIPLRELHAPPLQSTGWTVKRLIDIAVSGAGLLVASPILLACVVAVRLSSPGPVLFRQLRIGQHRRPFEVLKFRSMHVNDVSDTAWTQDNDPRQTAVGRYLRRTNLDELPQLWNVFRGDMSLVGPRPERPHFVDLFEVTIRHYGARHRVPVGITGLAQIHGLRGDTSISERVRFDNRYIDSWSLWQDVVIVARTFAQVIRKGS